MATDDVLFNKLKLKTPFAGEFNALVGERLYYFDEHLNITGIRYDRDNSQVEPGVNLYDDFLKHQPLSAAYIGDKKYCMNCGSLLQSDYAPICRSCGVVVSWDRDKFTANELRDKEIRLSRYSQDVIRERANIVRYLIESPLIRVTSDINVLEFKMVDDLIRHFEQGDYPWRFRAIANNKFFRNMVPNLNIRYSFDIDNISTDLVKFLKVMEVRLEGIGEDEIVQLDESMVQQLRYSYVMNRSEAKDLMCSMIQVGSYPDHDYESFCQAVPMLVDNGVVYVTRSGSVEYDTNKLINIKKKEFCESMTVDGYTPSVKPEVQFNGYYESTGTWYNI